MIAPESVYTSSRTDTLADVREYIACCPEALYLEPEALARRLVRPTAEVQAAREWLFEDGLEVRA
jgi:hypothetical protein